MYRQIDSYILCQLTFSVPSIIMSYKQLLENQHDENSDAKIHRLSNRSNTLAKQELAKFGVLVDKVDSAFSGAALNLLLDNMASASDIMNVLETEVHRIDCRH